MTIAATISDNATSTDAPSANAPRVTDYTVGQQVYVKAFGHWYVGTVAKLGRSRVHVTYTSGTGVTRTKSCKLAEVATEHPGESRARRPRRYTRVVDPVVAADPDGTQRAAAINRALGLHGLRLLVAFQGLNMPKGMQITRSATRKYCAQVITEMTGLKCSPRWRCTEDDMDHDQPLVGYLAALIRHIESDGVTVVELHPSLMQ